MRWPWSKSVEQPSNAVLSISDPLLVELFNPGGMVDIAGVSVNEHTALNLSAFWRAMSLISGTLAGLPFPTYREGPSGREKVGSIFDDPTPDGQTVFEWKETAFLHLLMHGRAGALKVRNEAGGLVALPLVHPSAFTVEQPTPEDYAKGNIPAGGVWFWVSTNTNERVRYDATDFWYVPGMSLDGQVGLSLIGYARLSLATTIAGDKAAGNMFANGALISGLATPDEEQDISEDVPEIRRQLNNSVSGVANAGAIAVVNRKLKFTPWSMSAVDAQFLGSRQFQIEEVSRWTGVPPHLLMQTEKQTSWGSGVDEQNRGLSRFVLGNWANRFEQRASRLLARPRWCEFDFAGLERPNFATEVDLLLKQTGGKPILTQNEARAVRNLPPVEGGDVLNPPAPTPAPAPEDDQEDDDDAPAE